MFKCLQYDRFHTSSWVNITIHRFWNWAIFLHKKNENWMHFHKVQNHTPYNFRHSEPMLCHHLNPVDEKLGEQRNKTKERKKWERAEEKAGERQQHQQIHTRRLWLLEWWPWRAFSESAWDQENEGDWT